MTNPNDLIHEDKTSSKNPITGEETEHKGLTKREWFAGQALAGLTTDDCLGPKDAAQIAVEMADELIKELNEDN